MSKQKPEKACVNKKRTITRKDLPLSCPMPHQQLWDAHPKVFLPIEADGKAVCPYCGIQYILDNST